MTATKQSNSAWPMVAIGGVVLAAIVLVVVLTRDSGVSADFELVPPDQVTTVADGGPAATGTSLDGTGTVSVPVGGAPTMVVFLAHWCPHCQREVPVVQTWLDSGGLPDGVEIRAVATSIDPVQPNYPPNAWLEGEAWTVPTVIDDGSIAEAFGLTGLPFWAIVDADGQVVTTASGEQTPEQLDAMASTITG